MKNRRNYYRLLHVQPDAPLAVIKSSYCSLMLKLKQHPDLGGDHENAALINEAYRVLTSPERRAEYDRHLVARQSKASIGNGPLNRSATDEPFQAPLPPRTASPPPASCQFCHAPHQGLPRPGVRCSRCDSPLAPPVPIHLEESDQRAVRRFASHGEVILLRQHTLERSRATIEDLSPSGMCVSSREALPAEQVVRVEGATLCAIARVVSCRQPKSSAPPTSHLVGLEFLTLEFAATRGTFVSSRT